MTSIERLSKSPESGSHDQCPGYLVVTALTPAADRVDRRAIRNPGHDDTEGARAFGTGAGEILSHRAYEFLIVGWVRGFATGII